LEQIDLAIEQGSSLAVLGRNGVGKTTLLRTLLGAAR
jgi:ABC-type branched-chain amino acid transport systems, ATPase component